MERPTKVFFNGSNVDGLSVEFKTISETWSEYALEDGSTVRVKPVVAEFVRLPQQYDPEGNPMYVARIQNVLVPTTPERLRKKQ